MSNMFECVLSGGSGAITLTVTCDSDYAGTTITATDGETTLTATCPSSSPYTVEFKIPNSGSWTISGTVQGDTQTITVIIPDSATLTLPIPTGATVTPINNVQIWMHCANVWDKNYTSISQVLADTSLVTTLIASNNAADYMARSTSWANSVTANASAMTKIGANDYCANKLLANSTWRNAICNSTYFESVLNVKVPTMTSNTAPYGEVIASSEFITTQPPRYAYKAFDGDSVSNWVSNSGMPQWIGYKFTNPTCVKKVKLVTDNYGAGPKTSKLQGSNDGINWVDIGDFVNCPNLSTEYSNDFDNNGYYLYNRLYITETNYPTYATCVTLQFYGRSQS